MPPAHTFFCKSKMLLLKRNNGNNGNKMLYFPNVKISPIIRESHIFQRQ